MSIMKQKQYEVRAKDFRAHKLPELPVPYFWKLWCLRSLGYLELRKKGRVFSKIIDSSSLLSHDFESLVDMVEETAYHIKITHIDSKKKE